MREETSINREILYSVLLERLAEKYLCLELHDTENVFHIYSNGNPFPVARLVVYDCWSEEYLRATVNGTLCTNLNELFKLIECENVATPRVMFASRTGSVDTYDVSLYKHVVSLLKTISKSHSNCATDLLLVVGKNGYTLHTYNNSVAFCKLCDYINTTDILNLAANSKTESSKDTCADYWASETNVLFNKYNAIVVPSNKAQLIADAIVIDSDVTKRETVQSMRDKMTNYLSEMHRKVNELEVPADNFFITVDGAVPTLRLLSDTLNLVYCGDGKVCGFTLYGSSKYGKMLKVL